MKNKLLKLSKFLLGIFLLIIVIPFVHPIKVHNPIAGVYFIVHGTYAESVDYDNKNSISIPPVCLFRLVTKTGSELGSEADETLEEVHLPITIKTIGQGSFFRYEELRKVTGGENVKFIEMGAFGRCHKLSDITNFEKVEIIGDSAFSECNIVSISFSDKLNEIEDSAFSHNNIEKLTLPINLKKIGNYAFCDNNISYIDGDLDSIEMGQLVFSDNPIEWTKGNFVVNGHGVMQKYYGNDEVIVIPNNVKVIDGSFENYNSTEELGQVDIYIPNSVVKVTDGSFFVGGRVRVFIPENVIEFDEHDEEQHVFYNDNDVTIVTTKGSTAESFAKKYNINCEIVDEIVYPDESDSKSEKQNSVHNKQDNN